MSANSPMPMRQLGRVGPVSALGFGAMRLPLNSEAAADVNTDLAVAMIRQAIDAGVTYVDTAYGYHDGHSEPTVGKALKDGYRERVKVATKLPLWLVQTRADMDRLLDEQLTRLGVPYIDVYLAHNVNGAHWGRMLELDIGSFFSAALKDGRIRHAGFSFHDSYTLFEQTLGYFDWDVVQIQYNYLDELYQAGRRGMVAAARRNMGVIAMEPLRGGFLVNNLPEESLARLKALRPDWTTVDWALRWLWDQPEIGTVLSGMSLPEQVTDNLRVARASAVGQLTQADKDALTEVRKLFDSRIKVGCTGCGYCLPCPQGVAIPKIFGYYNDYHLADQEEVRERARFVYNFTVGPHERADKCVDCGVCLDKCPQRIGIPEAMTGVTAVFHQEPAE